ncbi:cysteinyl-tRNA synthetase [Desulfonauticus submarinus]|uniref:Cysteine--tRNA ligase n=1 Tax=Desulfonauticus submarinus TaxID=206665 RepID=A0A1G9ZJP6_9BACT|nr:cysteine--tRNA ligase [Desulfonauticus submarinus]SDN21508.1 cysteinyl-tRNA synthetase [Desulfonauticus submarinus]
MLIYNSFSRKKEEIKPLKDKKLGVYVCGITAYDYCHIGHARSAVVFDVLIRYLRFLGYDVKFVRNFTDIDDKIIKRANEEGISCEELAAKYIDAFYKDMDALNILRADIEPKATEHIEEMIELTKILLDKGYAYLADNGDVYFRVRKFSSYGALSGRNIEELQAGARIAPEEKKEDPLDFVLWKSAKPGEPSWDSPWGKGRPGWHLECSAMSKKYLGIPFDIHGGGQDLIFPHHENERAQSEAAYGTTFVKYWVHNGFVQVNSEKMSKSLGNFITIRDILNNYHPEVLRFFLLTKHYKSPLDYNVEALEESEKALKKIYKTLKDINSSLEIKKWKNITLKQDLIQEFNSNRENFFKALDDDLNTAKGLGFLFNVVRILNRILSDKNYRKSVQTKEMLEVAKDFFEKVKDILGILYLKPDIFLNELKTIQLKRKNIDLAKVEELISSREQARKNKDFTQADALREELDKMGIEIKDTPLGTEWDLK